MSEKEFINGLIAKKPSEKAPEFIKCNLSIKRADLIQYLQGKTEEWLNIDIKESKEGKYYAEINNWKPQKQDHNNSPF
jgi:hypothetical protein